MQSQLFFFSVTISSQPFLQRIFTVDTFFFLLATSQYFRSALSNDTSCHLLIQFLTIAWTHSASHFHHILWNFPFYLFLYFLFFLFHILHPSCFSSDQISISNGFVYCLACLFCLIQSNFFFLLVLSLFSSCFLPHIFLYFC